jgi:RNA polymerase sigma factor (TIGR02999 family)
MSSQEPTDASRLEAALALLAAGDVAALDEVFALAYEDLRVVAHRRLELWRPGETVNTTVLVHEAYVRVRQGNYPPPLTSRDHFFRYAARAMRHILIDHARERGALKRGGAKGGPPPPPTVVLAGPESRILDVLAVDLALKVLAQRSRRLEEVVECRFFGGLNAAETADALGVSLRTVERDWTRARTYLHEILADSPEGPVRAD